MKFESLIDHTESQTDYSQLFVQYDFREYSLSKIIYQIEKQGGSIIAVKIFDSDVTDCKIAYLKLNNNTTQDIAMGLNENGLYDVQSVNRLIKR